MGRPINKHYIGNISQAGQAINPTAYFIETSAAQSAWIKKQESRSSYMVCDVTGAYTDHVSLVNGNVALLPGQANITVTPFGATGSGAAATANLGIRTVTVVSGGNGTVANGFAPGQILYPTSGTYTTGYRANIYVDTVQLGIATVTTNTGYTVGDSFTWNYAGWSTPTVLTVQTTSGNGNISGLTYTSLGVSSNIQITNATPFSSSVTANAWATSAVFSIRWDMLSGTAINSGDYSSAPANPVQLTGSAHGINSNINAGWGISSVQVTNLGNLYQAASVTFSSGNANALATVNQTTGNVTSISVTVPGTYTSTAPTVTISPIKSIEYASVIKNRTVTTFSGNTYEWVMTGTTPVDGQAVLQSA